MAILVVWLTANFGLPEPSNDPEIRFTSEIHMLEARLGAATEDIPEARALSTVDIAGQPGNGLHALYDDAHHVVHLLDDWSAGSPADVSILVHELVHHMQNDAGLTFECAEAREKLAYQAQSRWLQGFGTSLEREFGLDPMTVLVRSNCWY